MSRRDVADYLERAFKASRFRTQTELGREVGISQQTISAYLRGDRPPEPEHVHALAAALDVAEAELALLTSRAHADESKETQRRNKRLEEQSKRFERFADKYEELGHEYGALGGHVAFLVENAKTAGPAFSLLGEQLTRVVEQLGRLAEQLDRVVERLDPPDQLPTQPLREDPARSGKRR